ncbi:MAG: hypothetical protein ACLSE8_04385 [Parasutterella sp.]
MDINWSRYIEIARAQDLDSAEVARLIRTETRRKVNISEVKRRLSISDPRQHKVVRTILWTLLIFANLKQMRSRR